MLTLPHPSGRTTCRLGVLGLAVVVGLLSQTASPAARAAQVTNALAPAELSAQARVHQAEAQRELTLALSLRNGTTNLPPGSTPGEALQYRLTLELLVRSYQQQREEAEALAQAQTNGHGPQTGIQGWTGFSERPPYSIQAVDALRDAIDSLKASIAASETTLSVVQTFGVEARSMLDSAEERLRLITEQLENAQEPGPLTRLNWERTLEQSRHRLATAQVALYEIRRQRVELELTARQQGLLPLQRQLVTARPQVRFAQFDLEAILRGLEVEREALDTESRAAEVDKESCQSALDAARKEQAKLLEGAAAPSSAAARSSELRAAEERAQLRAAQADTAGQRLTVLGQLQDLNLHERGLWESRFTVFASKDLVKVQRGYRGLSRLTALIQAAKPHFTKQVELSGNLVTEQQRRLSAATSLPVPLAFSEELLESYQRREQYALRALRGFEKLERLALRWKESLDEERRALPLSGRLRDLFNGFSSLGQKIWDFELFAAQDTITVDGQAITGRRSVTIAKVVKALLILLGGYGLGLVLSRVLERMAVRRFKIEPNQASLIRRWLRVVFVLVLAGISLALVKIPLTVFAFLGGALAIGFGFGTQNLLKNFISGIIILFERPFRVGDVLDVGNRRGTVTSIGIRSSVLQLFDSTETLIPNSALLENQLTNWTYSSGRVRFTIAVGVAYGTDTRKVSQCLAEVVARHGQVEKDPAPQIFFQEFGDSALQFELRYWVDVRKFNAAQIGSDLRHMIAVSFADHGLVLAFPQRDVHLDTAGPLQVQMISERGVSPRAAS